MAQVSFKMPWGRMSGLSFGNRASKNVFLCLHGWQDNSALYKPLLQNLPQENHYLALDLMARMPNIHLFFILLNILLQSSHTYAQLLKKSKIMSSSKIFRKTNKRGN